MGLGQPSVRDVHNDATLTEISIALKNDMDAFIADKVFPVVPVKHRSDKYYVYTTADLLRSETSERAETAESAIRGHSLSTATYTCVSYAVSELVSDNERKNADDPLDPDEDATMVVTQDGMIHRENKWATDFFTQSVWDTDLTPSTLWDASGSDPIGDIDTAKATIQKNTGIPQNMLSAVMQIEVWNVVKRHADILNAFGGGNPGNKVATVDFVKDLLGLKNLWIAGSVQNTNVEGNATQTPAFIFGQHCLILFTPDRPSPRQAAAGYTFEFESMNISRFREDAKRSDRIEMNTSFDQKVVSTAAGYLLDDVLT
jgi:hypothetical protein